jgi:hypothetical protein
MRMKLRVKLAAGIVEINRYHEIASCPVILDAISPHAGGCIRFKLMKGFIHSIFMSLKSRLSPPSIAIIETDLGAEIVKS